MTPVTRRSARIAEDTLEGESAPPSSDAVNTSEAPLAKDPVSPREKRKSTENSIINGSDHEDGDASLDPTPTSPKRQRLAVRTREDESTATGRRTHLEVEIPISLAPAASRADSVVPDPQDGQETVGPELEPASASKQLEEEASQRLASLEPEQTPMAKPQPKGKHITFGDDEDVNKFVLAAAKVDADVPAENEAQVNANDDKEDSDDDDEAPEAVSTQAVAKEMHRVAQVASEAAEK